MIFPKKMQTRQWRWPLQNRCKQGKTPKTTTTSSLMLGLASPFQTDPSQWTTYFCEWCILKLAIYTCKFCLCYILACSEYECWYNDNFCNMLHIFVNSDENCYLFIGVGNWYISIRDENWYLSISDRNECLSISRRNWYLSISFY